MEIFRTDNHWRLLIVWRATALAMIWDMIWDLVMVNWVLLSKAIHPIQPTQGHVRSKLHNQWDRPETVRALGLNKMKTPHRVIVSATQKCNEYEASTRQGDVSSIHNWICSVDRRLLTILRTLALTHDVIEKLNDYKTSDTYFRIIWVPPNNSASLSSVNTASTICASFKQANSASASAGACKKY